MNISAPFIHRPIGTSLLTIAVLLAGIVGYALLPVAPLPEVEFPTIQVVSQLPGASPETMASSVATPLERQFSRIAGLDEMTSTSLLGSTTIVLQFDLDRNIDAASRDVQAAINAAAGQLPSDLPNAPDFWKINPTDRPILILAMTSSTMRKGQLYDLADSIVTQKLAQVSGVGQVFAGGGARPAVRIAVNPMALAQYGIGLDAVRAAVGATNSNEPKGDLENGRIRWFIDDNDQMFRPEQYRRLIVAYRNGAPVRLQDVATVYEAVEDINNAGLINREQGIMIMVFRQPEANIVATVQRVRAIIPELQASIPAAAKLFITSDRSLTIRASVDDVEAALLASVILVILMIFLFLRNVWATAVPAIAVPVSLVGTFGVMYLCGYSVDNLSLMALTISTGFVVDDAIVVIENVARYLESGMAPLKAALRGSEEIGFTVLSMSTSLVAVFIPILLMGGIVGRLFREFAVTLSVAIGVSLLVSLTTTPMMCAKFLKPHRKEHQGRFMRASERAFENLRSTYDMGLRWVLRHQPLTLAITLATLCLSIFLYVVIPKGFFPEQDTGSIGGSIQASQDISFDAMRVKQKQFSDIVLADHAVQNLEAFVGGRGGTMNTGRMWITLKPLSERKATADEVIDRLRQNLAVVPGATLYLQASQDIRIGGHSTSGEYQYSLEDEDLKELNALAPRMFDKLQALPELRDVSTDQQNMGLEATVQIDRDTASRLGISPQAIDDALYDAFGQRQVSTLYTQLNQYHVVLEVDPRFQRTPDSLKSIYVRSGTGAEVPLSSIVHFVSQYTSLAVNHEGQFPAVTFSFNLAPNVALGNAVIAIQGAEAQVNLPASIHANFQGTAEAFMSSLSNEPLLILAALLAVYIVLGILYESYIHPITILSTLPSAGVGALLALLITRTDLTVIALIGIILLIGIVKKNAILMIDFALDAERRLGMSPEESIYQACILRFRPIMMTTMAALFGALPLALGKGMGAEMRRPLGISIVGGLIVSQMLTLFTTPVIYLYMDRFRLFWARRRHAASLPAPPRHSPGAAD